MAPHHKFMRMIGNFYEILTASDKLVQEFTHEKDFITAIANALAYFKKESPPSLNFGKSDKSRRENSETDVRLSFFVFFLKLSLFFSHFSDIKQQENEDLSMLNQLILLTDHLLKICKDSKSMIELFLPALKKLLETLPKGAVVVKSKVEELLESLASQINI